MADQGLYADGGGGEPQPEGMDMNRSAVTRGAPLARALTLLLIPLLASCMRPPPPDGAYLQPLPPPNVEIVAPNPPPAPQVETQPAAPAANTQYFYWDPGHWHWTGSDWFWIPGHYVEKPYTNAYWVPGHWDSRPYGWTWIPGYWAQTGGPS